MVTAVLPQGPLLELPWSVGEQDEQRFKKLLKWAAIIFLIFAIGLPLIPVPEQAREEQEKLPENLARLVLEQQAIPEPVIEPPPPPVVEETPPEVVETPPPQVQAPEPVEPAPVQEAPEPPAQVVEAARQRASVSGLLQFRDDLQQMRDMVDVEAVSSAELVRTESQATETRRDLLASRATSESGGIQVDDVSVDAGGVALSGRENTVVDSSLALPGGTGTEVVYSEAQDGSGGPGLPYRSEEEMRRVMDANKSAIFAIYNRALRTDPTLQGKLVFALTIEPSGLVSLVSLIDSQLADDDLVSRLLTRIELIQFPAGEYASTTLNQTFDFLPY